MMAGTSRSNSDKPNIFISYSRDDLDFADQLALALGLHNYDVNIDRHRISGGEDWKTRLGLLIRDADTVVFVLSRSSAASAICAWEVSEATRLGKRILPVICRALDGAAAPAQLAALNYIFFYSEPKTPGAGFGSGLAQLIEALNSDLGWLREHTRLLQRAVEWDAAGRTANRLLFGESINEAKAWVARRPKNAPEPTALHFDYIRASEEAERRRQNMERRRLEAMAASQADRAAALAKMEAAQKREFLAQRQAAELAQREAKQARRLAVRTRTGLIATLVLLAAAVAGWLEARDQAKYARFQQGRAEESLRLADRTANLIVFDVANALHTSVGVPQSVARDILQRTSGLLNKLPSDGISPPAVMRTRAVALLELAKSFEQALQVGDASTAANQASELFKRIAALEPQQPEHIFDYSLSLEFLANIDADFGRQRAAAAKLQQVFEIRRQLISDFGAREEWQIGLANAGENLAVQQLGEGKMSEAAAILRSVLRARGELAEKKPADQDLLRSKLEEPGTARRSASFRRQFPGSNRPCLECTRPAREAERRTFL